MDLKASVQLHLPSLPARLWPGYFLFCRYTPLALPLTPIPHPNPLSPLRAITSLVLINRLLIFALSEVLPLLGRQAHSDNVTSERACKRGVVQ